MEALEVVAPWAAQGADRQAAAMPMMALSAASLVGATHRSVSRGVVDMAHGV